MTATAPQAAVSWSSVAKRRSAVLRGWRFFGFAPPPYHSPQAGKGRRGRRAVSCVSTDGAQVTKRKVKADDADDQPVDPQAAGGAKGPQKGAGPAAIAAEAGRMHARLHHHAQEAEFGAAQGREGASDQRVRGHRVHSGGRPL